MKARAEVGREEEGPLYDSGSECKDNKWDEEEKKRTKKRKSG